MKRLHLGAVTTLAALVLGACTPPSPPGPPTWNPTYVSPTPTADARISSTSLGWWAILRTSPTTGLPVTLDLHRRTGPNGEPSATPTESIVVSGGIPVAMAMTDRVIAIASRFLDQVSVGILRYDDPNAQWVPATPNPVVPTDPALRIAPNAVVKLDVTDTAVALSLSYQAPQTGTGRVIVQQLTSTPTSVTTGPIQVLSPPPAWSSFDQEGFGRSVSLEGDLLAVSGGSDHVVLYQSPGGAGPWSQDGLLVNPEPPSSENRFGASVSVDTSSATSRVLVGTRGSFGLFGPPGPAAGRADLWQRGPAGWVMVRTLNPPDSTSQVTFGQQVALDGDLGVVANSLTLIGPVADYGVGIYRMGTGALEATLSGVPPSGPSPTLLSAGLTDLTLVGSHLSTVLGESFTTSSRVSAVTWDRVPNL